MNLVLDLLAITLTIIVFVWLIASIIQDIRGNRKTGFIVLVFTILMLLFVDWRL